MAIYRGASVPGSGKATEAAASDITIDDSGAYYTADNVEDALQEIAADSRSVESDLAIHSGYTDNPHNVIADQIPITDSGANFTATDVEAALAEEADARQLHEADVSNPHSVTYTQVGAAPTVHTHDDRYYTETETDTLLSGKSDTTHNHDTDYLGITAKAADSDKLDSLDSTQFLRSDTNDTATGAITFNEPTTFNDYLNRVTGSGNSAWLQQDGTARVHWYWNTYGGTTPVFTVGGEDAVSISMHDGDGGRVFFRSADGTSALAGDPITWTTTLNVSPNTFTYKGSTIWHAGNLDASDVPITDTAGNYTSTNVEDALAEVYAEATSAAMNYFAEGRDVTVSINDTVPVHSWEVTGIETNIDVALVPKGTGAITAHVADGTAAGGNKRGLYAVDMQTARSVNTSVASGDYSIVLGGIDNKASGDYAIAGGNAGSASGDLSIALGNNASASAYGAVSIGGLNSSASGQYSGMFSGHSSIASGTYSLVIGGLSNVASGTNSIAMGRYANDNGIFGKKVFGGGNFGATSTQGEAQLGEHPLIGETTDATTLSLSYDEQTTGYPTLADSHSYAITATVVARDTSTGDTKTWEIKGVAKRGSGAATVALVGTPTKSVIAEDTGASTWDCNLVVNTTRGSAEIEVTGEAAKTIHWVCKFDTVEVG